MLHDSARFPLPQSVVQGQPMEVWEEWSHLKTSLNSRDPMQWTLWSTLQEPLLLRPEGGGVQ